MEIRIERSVRRRYTVSARFEHGILVIRIPASLTPQEEAQWVHRLQQRFTSPHIRCIDDCDLSDRARKLAPRYLPLSLPPLHIRYVNNQQWRWGSCSPRTGEIRVSDRLTQLPQWVRDYVIIHELAHLILTTTTTCGASPLATHSPNGSVASSSPLITIAHNPHSRSATPPKEHLEGTSNIKLTKE